jgi:branched-chain amino acid transport system substrate-binding protein
MRSFASLGVPDNTLSGVGGRAAMFWVAAVGLAIGLASIGPSRAQDVVKLGEIEAQTGALNTYGWMSAQGMRMAVDKINKDGGFEVAGKTYKLQLLNPDTQGNPQQALIELKKMLDQEQVKYVLGPFLTNVYKGIAPYAQANNGKFLLIGGATAIEGSIDGWPGWSICDISGHGNTTQDLS